VRVATWNVNSLKARLPRVEEFLGYADVDVLCLQETKLADATFPTMAFETLGYESAHHGQGQWNGVAILSRVGINNVERGFSEDVRNVASDDEYVRGVLAEARSVTAMCGGVEITSVYVPNGRSLDDPHYGAKLVWLDELTRQYARRLSAHIPSVLCGDFNIAPEDHDVWDPRKFIGSTHVTPAERAKLTDLRSVGFTDLFRQLYRQDRLYTYWDYRAGDFHQHRGMRIDLMYGTAPVSAGVTWAIVDRNARKGKLPSDHAPVIVDFTLAPQVG
jgi:exodeoxyribonuclease III